MRNFREIFAQFMIGRYGVDQLNKVLLAAGFIFIILNTFISSPIISFFLLLIMCFTLFRTYSKNLEKRSRENEIFLQLWKKTRKKISLFFRIIKECRTHRFRKCPGCRATIRMPRKRGTRIIKCPRCQTEFKTRIYL